MSASGVSGKSGTITGISGECVAWTLTRSCFIGAYGSNESGEGTSKVAGRKDAKGTATFKTNPSVGAGDSASAVLSNAEATYSCDIVISEVTANTDINTGDVNGYDVSFEVDGAVTAGTVS